MSIASPPGEVVVGVGELGVAAPPTRTLATYALGSCVAVFAWDPLTHLSGCLHFMRPTADPGTRHPAKFADTGLPELLDAVAPIARRSLRLVACGGATITASAARYRVGPKNVAALIQLTGDLGLVLAAHDLGGTWPRSAILDLGTGRVTVVTRTHANLSL